MVCDLILFLGFVAIEETNRTRAVNMAFEKILVCINFVSPSAIAFALGYCLLFYRCPIKQGLLETMSEILVSFFLVRAKAVDMSKDEDLQLSEEIQA